MVRKWFINIHIYSYKISTTETTKPELYVCSWQQIQIWKAEWLQKGILKLFSISALLTLDHSELDQQVPLLSDFWFDLIANGQYSKQESRTYSWNVYPLDSPTTLTAASSWWLHLSTERESSGWVSFSTCCPSHVLVKNFVPLPLQD